MIDTIDPALIEKGFQWGLETGLRTKAVEESHVADVVERLNKEFSLSRPNTPIKLMGSPRSAWALVCLIADTKDEVTQELLDTLAEEAMDIATSGRKDPRMLAYVEPYLCGAFDAPIFAFYDTLLEAGVKLEDKLQAKYDLWRESKDLGQIWILKDQAVVVSQHPEVIHMVDGRLHCDGGPAIKYADGFRVWALNGVRVSQYLAETPSGELDMAYYSKIDSADVKSEFVRKYGVERMLDTHAKIVESWTDYTDPPEFWRSSQYELWDFSPVFDGIEYQPAVKMLNPSTGVWHVEFVSPECTTLEQALKERGLDFDVVAQA